MEIKINTNISSELKNVSITINVPELNEETQNVIEYVSEINTSKKQIVASKDYKIYFIDVDDVICIFSKNKCNYIRAKDDLYKIKYRLYEIDEKFNYKGFIRISKSCIVNINQVDCFDISMLGTMVVKLKDGTEETVSRRKTRTIMKYLEDKRM